MLMIIDSIDNDDNNMRSKKTNAKNGGNKRGTCPPLENKGKKKTHFVNGDLISCLVQTVSLTKHNETDAVKSHAFPNWFHLLGCNVLQLELSVSFREFLKAAIKSAIQIPVGVYLHRGRWSGSRWRRGWARCGEVNVCSVKVACQSFLLLCEI